ncbi:LOG family protein [Nitrospina watsonii]|uniref:Rossmann fold nucleotide-binding protein-like n=1 Tax=Nitrospina watsonii TaxID=1323948 RepID=A0ABN8VZ04_9BACT|nr:LOG family protein [Nitrospina watsonii]CAI2718523.1 Rossmann fold nucleotide-binding protein-like [Nitrospina watsonii]
MAKKTVQIGIIGSGTNQYAKLTWPIGRWIAEQGFNLVNGGGGGVMESISQAFHQVSHRKGKVIGILPSGIACDRAPMRSHYKSPPGYPNDFVDIPIYTHLHLSGIQGKGLASRNHIIVLTSDLLIAFPGGPGTRSEVQLALEYKKPLVLLNKDHIWDEFSRSEARVVNSPDDVIAAIRSLEPDWFN